VPSKKHFMRLLHYQMTLKGQIDFISTWKCVLIFLIANQLKILIYPMLTLAKVSKSTLSTNAKDFS